MAANLERGEVDVEVGGRTLTLKPGMNGICVMEKRAGRPYGELVNAMMDTDVTAMRDLLHMFLQAFHSKEFVNVESVGLLMDDIGDALDVRKVLSEVVLANRSRKKATDPLTAQAGTSATSGVTPDASA